MAAARTPAVLCSFVIASGAAAQLGPQVTPVAPFAGELTEGFEGRPRSQTTCLSGGVFNGEAELCATTSVISTTNVFACSITARTGGRMFHSTFSPATFTFNEPVMRFGGYFGANHGGEPGADVEFFDSAGNLIGVGDAVIPADCSWTWNGWQSDVPVTTIVVAGRGAPGFGGQIQMDDLVADSELPCYPDCSQATGPGRLDIFDFICWVDNFFLQDPYACDCDTSTGAGVCDILDFVCFRDAFFAGCP